MKMYRISI